MDINAQNTNSNGMDEKQQDPSTTPPITPPPGFIPESDGSLSIPDAPTHPEAAITVMPSAKDLETHAAVGETQVNVAVPIPSSSPTEPSPAPTAPAAAKETPAETTYVRTKAPREIPLQEIPTIAAAPTPEVTAPASEPLPAPQKESAIRTLQSDIAHTVRSNQLSIAHIALAQKEKGRGVVDDTTEGRGKNVALTVLSIFLILAGLGALVGAVYFIGGSPGAPFFEEENQTFLIVPAKKVEAFDVSTTTRTAVLARIDAFMKNPDAVPLEVRALVMTRETQGTTTQTTTLSFEDFATLVALRAPGRLIRTLGPDMMVGAVGNEPFVLVTHTSYENAFAGLLEWESQMADDLPFLVFTPPERPSFTPEVASSSESAATATSSPLSSATSSTSSLPAAVAPSTSIPSSATWKDIVVKNIDTRALLRDADEELLMLYTFLRDDLLLITSRKETMAVILQILTTPSFGE